MMNRYRNDTDELAYAVLSLVSEIPAGKVLSYGKIAELLGRKKNSRLVGKILSEASYYGSYPCHRVVNHCGRTAPGFTEQRQLLEAEGVIFKQNGCVDMKRYSWDIDDE